MITTYRDIGTTNAVKLLPIIRSLNGYIQLFTELDHHIEVGDHVFITYSGNTETLSNMDLDNFYYVNKNADIYHPYSQGYKVLFVNKEENSFTIERFIFTIDDLDNFKDHFVSSVRCDEIEFTGGSINSTVFLNAEIEPIDNEISLEQCVMFKGEINNTDIKNKYLDSHRTLKLTDNEDGTYTKNINLNNNGQGYSIFYNLTETINDSDIYGGFFYNCNLTSTNDNKIYNGFFEDCTISGYTINGGYFNNTELSDNCVWNNGYWTNDDPFTLNWGGGVFVNGIFEGEIWQNGTFIDGEWRGLTWWDGKFLGGKLIGVDYIDGDGKRIVSTWENGRFNGGEIEPVTQLVWLNGRINGGKIKNLVFNDGEIYGGEFGINVFIKKSNIFNGNFKTEIFKLSIISNSNIYNMLSDFYLLTNNKIFNGNFNLNVIFNNIIDGGDFKEIRVHYPSIINNGIFNKTRISNFTTSCNKSFLKRCIVKFKNLFISGDPQTKTKTLLFFPDGHDFTINDEGKTIRLLGFESPELNITTTISNQVYEDGLGNTHNNVGSNYITIDSPEIDENWKTTFFNNTGLVLCFGIDNIDGYYNINGGIFNNMDIIQENDNININGGLFNYCKFNFDPTNVGIYNSSLINAIFSCPNWSGGNSYTTPFEIPYKIDYSLLKERKLHYDIAPWDKSNEKYNNVIKKIIIR